ncbi:MAG: class I SAM-dependent methyltransferase [Candidatus Cloacimonetes bacterium]|nr:class I SAM-dependent methyltransferase [Candidatus Cloacimonadota bacterium]
MLYYDFPDAYDLFYTESFRKETLDFYQRVFSSHKIRDVIDCTVGSGQMTIPLAKMGYNILGTDLNSHMIRKARDNFSNEGFMPQLVTCNILELSQRINRKFDLVVSTGNSLAHVRNNELEKALHEMDSLLKPGGFLYFDSRNWEAVLRRQQRFYLFNPIIRDKGRVNYLQVWDYNKDDSMTFNFLLSEEIDDKIVSKRQFYVVYYPFTIEQIKSILSEMNYKNIQIFKLGNTDVTDLEKIDWYSLIAEKPILQPEKKKKTKKRILF